MRKIVIASVLHSDNLGDCVIATCFRYLIEKMFPNVQIVELDLGGRTSVQDNDRIVRRLLRWIYFRLPKFIRPLVPLTVWIAGGRRALSRIWKDQIYDADLIVIAGGQIFADNSLNFPLKTYTLSQLASRLQIPIAFNACGAVGQWSKIGKAKFASVLINHNTVSISTRDDASRDYLYSQLPALNDTGVEVIPDPGVWSNILSNDYCSLIRGYVGLCVVAPREVVDQTDKYSIPQLYSFWLDLVRTLTRQNVPTAIFTNGNSDDFGFANDLYQQLRRETCRLKGRSLTICDRPENIERLVTFIRSFRLVVTQRLHALVVAFSCGVPAVPVCWNGKLLAFSNYAHLPVLPQVGELPSIESVTKIALSPKTAQPHEKRLEEMQKQAKQHIFEVINSVMED